MPGFAARLAGERNKIAILGNGLSNLGVGLAERHACGTLHDVPVAVDLIDYDLVLKDLQALSDRITSAGLRFPFAADLNTVEAMLQWRAQGHLEIVKHCFGRDPQKSDKMSGASLAINSFGPPFSTLAEQLNLLARGGELWLGTYVAGELGSLYSVRPFDLPELDGTVALDHPSRFSWGCVIRKN
jgi:hypothetical protein